MVYLDPVAVVAEGVPWWVILLAVLAGLLVLALLVLLLWKVRLGDAGLLGPGFSVPPALSFLPPICTERSYVPGTLSGSGRFREKSDADLVLWGLTV